MKHGCQNLLSQCARDRRILLSSGWLNDGIICAAQRLLAEQTKGKVLGLQSTQFCKKPKSRFKQIPPRLPFIQVLHINGNHWIMVSNIDPRTNDNECMDVCIYDSMQSNSISQSLKKMICSFVKASDDFLNFQIVNVAGQTNTNDCGVYALAYTAKKIFSCNRSIYRYRSEFVCAYICDRPGGFQRCYACVHQICGKYGSTEEHSSVNPRVYQSVPNTDMVHSESNIYCYRPAAPSNL